MSSRPGNRVVSPRLIWSILESVLSGLIEVISPSSTRRLAGAMIVPLRVDEDAEVVGLDLTSHGERAYDHAS